MEIIYSGLNDGLNFFFNFQDFKCIDLLYLYNNNIKNINNDIKQQFMFNSSYDILYNTFQNLPYLKIDFNEIIKLHIFLFHSFKKDKTQIKINIHKNTILNYNLCDKKLIVRTGIIELQACNLTNNELIKQSILSISSNINNEKYIYDILQYKSKCWISIFHELEEYKKRIVKLMTNAGFYFSDNFENALKSFIFFKNGYIESIKNSDFLIKWNFLNCYSLNILNNIKKEKQITHIKSSNGTDLCILFDKKKILFLTPFKDLIDLQYNNGNIYKLRKNNNLTAIDLTTIEAFLTTYPNKKHNDFIETYNYYTNEIDKHFLTKEFDIFTCSCGCYGLLLCNYVYKKYNITSVYIGHDINHFFGIKTNRNSKIDLLNFNNEDLFLESNLHIKYKNMENIENNCYGYTK